MDKTLQEEIESLQKIVKDLQTYIQVLDDETYSIIKREVESIDYSDSLLYSYLQKHPKIKEQLERDYKRMIRAKIKQDFSEFCRYAWLQIEFMIDVFIHERETREEIRIDRGQGRKMTYIKSITVNATQNSYDGTAYQKLDLFCSTVFPDDERSQEFKQKIQDIMEGRHQASHRSFSGSINQ